MVLRGSRSVSEPEIQVFLFVISSGDFCPATFRKRYFVCPFRILSLRGKFSRKFENIIIKIWYTKLQRICHAHPVRFLKNIPGSQLLISISCIRSIVSRSIVSSYWSSSNLSADRISLLCFRSSLISFVEKYVHFQYIAPQPEFLHEQDNLCPSYPASFPPARLFFAFLPSVSNPSISKHLAHGKYCIRQKFICPFSRPYHLDMSGCLSCHKI